MEFVFPGTLEQLKEAIREKAKALHRDIVVYHNEPNILQIGFQRLAHNGGRFFIANITETDRSVILTGEAKDIFPRDSGSLLYKIWSYTEEFLLEYLVLGFIPFVLWFFLNKYVSLWVPALIPLPIMVLLELNARRAHGKLDGAFYNFMAMVIGEEITIPAHSQDLYKMLMHTPNLHSFPQIKDDIITWELYDDVYVETYMNEYDTTIDIIHKDTMKGSYLHWHPGPEKIYEELCALGKTGNILVLRKTLGGPKVFYMGDPEKYRFLPTKRWHWGKLIYLKQI